MATLHSIQQTSETVMYLKGAVEKVVGLCDRMLAADGREQGVDANAVPDQTGLFAGQGLRVLAFARKSGVVQAATLPEEYDRWCFLQPRPCARAPAPVLYDYHMPTHQFG